VTLGLSWAERSIAANAQAEAEPEEGGARPPIAVFLTGVALLGIGFQVHFGMNAGAGFLRFADATDLQYLMPVFWVGFNLLMLPATLLADRYGAVAVMALGSLVGAAAAWAALQAQGIVAFVAAQFVAGGAWGCVLMSATAAALAIGRTGREGGVLGGMFSFLALAAFVRIAVVAAQFGTDPGIAFLLPWTPVAAWLLGGVLLLVVAAREARRRA
jgi:MFS family permease